MAPGASYLLLRKKENQKPETVFYRLMGMMMLK
jgi:hypothetical protein